MPGFDGTGSDSRAIEIADDVMERLGGRVNWDATRFITWSFFGLHLHVWDKWTGDLRFEHDDLTVLVSIHWRLDQRQLLAGDAVQAQGQWRHSEKQRSWGIGGWGVM